MVDGLSFLPAVRISAVIGADLNSNRMCHPLTRAGRAGENRRAWRSTQFVVDADGHVCEPPDLWTTRLPARFRERAHPAALERRRPASTRPGSRTGCITDRGLVGLGNAGTSFADLGRGRRYADGHRAGFDPRARLEVLDAEGIDVAVLYGGLALSLPRSTIPSSPSGTAASTTTGSPSSARADRRAARRRRRASAPGSRGGGRRGAARARARLCAARSRGRIR